MSTAPDSTSTSRGLRRAVWLAGGALLVLGGGATLRVLASSSHADAVAEATVRNSVRSVMTSNARAGDPKRLLTLPGTLRGNTESSLYARTNGYLQRWTKDIGDRVKQGELLAVIDAPETEQELLQARANREQVRARLALAETSQQRWLGLRERDAVSQQDLEERQATLRQAQADLAATDANIKRLEQLQSFRRIVAPFDGVVVRRNVEVGALIGAGNNGATRELFHIAQTNPLRVSVAVPQVNASDVKIGQEATLKLAEKPGAPLKGKVTRTSGAVDPDSRAMQVEIELPNPDGKLLPGAYVEVSLSLVGNTRALIVPASALQFRQDGPRLAVVDADSKIVLKPVKLGRTFGKTVEVNSGITPTDRIVLNPHDAIEAGETVIAKASTL
jgi:RND family efflux transporter MFP subunit